MAALLIRGALHHLLNNRIYLGEIIHRGEYFPGQHKPIVSRELWDQVASRLKQNNRAHRSAGPSSTQSPLGGLLFDSSGVRFTPTQSRKNGKRYRYYTSQAVIQETGVKPPIAHFPAQELENFVAMQIFGLLRSPDRFVREIKDGTTGDSITKRIAQLVHSWPQLERAKLHQLIRSVVSRVTIGQSRVWVEIGKANLFDYLHAGPMRRDIAVAFRGKPILQLVGDFEIVRRDGEIHVIAPNDDSGCVSPVPSIVKAIARSRDWYERIVAGEFSTIEQLAENCGLTKRYVRKVLQCARLSPKTTEALIAGQHSPSLTLKKILDGVPLNWMEQRRAIFG